MKVSIVAVLALACVLSVATAQYFGQSYAPQQQSGGLLSSILPLLLLLLIFPTLFGSSSNNDGDTTIIFGNFSGPTGGK